MRKFLTAVFVIAIAQSASAQQASLSGTVKDTLGRKNLANAVVTLLQKKDSSLYKFVRTDKNGEFLFHNTVPGKYVLLVTYPKFADFSDEVQVKDQPQNSLDAIALTLKSQLLEA